MKKKLTKQQLARRRMFIYGFMTVSVVLIVTFLVFIMQGYQFNRQDGRIEQGGLLQFASQPSGAGITVNGNKLSFNTPNKLTVNSGNHTVDMNKNGYNSWSKTVHVNPGNIIWLNYIWFVPSERPVEKVQDFSSLAASLSSNDKKWIIALKDATSPKFDLINIEGDKIKNTELAMPETTYKHGENISNHLFTIDQWDQDNRYLIIHHNFKDHDADKNEWLVLDTRNINETKNISELLGMTAEKMEFSLGDNHILYALSNGEVRKVNLNDATLSRPLVSNVASFAQFDRATITYVSKLDPQTSKRTVGYYTDNAKTTRVIRSYADDGTTPLQFAIGQYFNDKYFAYMYGETLEISKGALPSSDSNDVTSYQPVVTMTLPNGADFFDFGSSERFVVAQKGQSITTYDLELGVTNNFTFPGEPTGKKAFWLDDFHIVSGTDGQARIYEFDGQNAQDLMAANPSQALVSSNNKKYFYSFIKNSDGSYALQRIKLIVN